MFAMDFKAFTLTHIYAKQGTTKEMSKSSIQCIECFDRNVYIGTKDATVQQLIFPSITNSDLDLEQSKAREGRARKLGSSIQVSKLKVVPLFNHLLVLWDRSLCALNMFSLEPVPALKKIQHISLFEVCNSSPVAQTDEHGVQMVTSSSRRKVIQIHVVKVDQWLVLREVPLLLDPVAFAVDGDILCVATNNKYLLCDAKTGNTEELFPHNQSRQQVITTSVGQGEFLLNGPGSLGMFVMKTGVCQRPPLQWPQEVLAAGICFPYILTLQSQLLSVYSMVDQQHKQTVSLSGAKGLLSMPDGVLVFTERDIFSLHLVPFQEQIQALVQHERVEEALLLLEGVQGQRPLDSHQELQKTITRQAGFVHFYQQGFSKAKDLFIKCELDPREVISLYPDIRSCLSEDFQSQQDQMNKTRALQEHWEEDRNTFHHYLGFLGDFLTEVRGTQPGLKCIKEVDCALVRLYVELEDTKNLQQLLAIPNMCDLDHCAPFLEENKRYYALGCLFQSQGCHIDAIQTWVKIADGIHEDPSCSDIYGHIVWNLSQLQDRDAVWKFADWTLQRDQETGVQIFSRHPQPDQNEIQEVLTLLEKYPLALLLYLEFLIYELKSEEEGHHSRLALSYVTQALQEEKEADLRKARWKLQQLLWESKFYDISTVYNSVEATDLHREKAILLGRMGEHSQALQELVIHEEDPRVAEAFCYRAAEGQGPQLKQTLLLTLVQIYLNSENLTSAAVDLLNNNPQDFAIEKVLQLLPDSWSVQLVSQFLTRSLRETLHQTRMVSLQTALSRVELMRHQVVWMQASKINFRQHEGQKCKVCQRKLIEPHFAWSLHSDPVHTSCNEPSSS
ncbi:transforming growth factor-beta receptor-associated protein 1 [Antennarius striatus]|uniref:transforming growth factor-beta receptor-associated protein 1 n=1 Tax=Antennarius striatus TaxID=241820 RepID=UPI0035B4C6D0